MEEPQDQVAQLSGCEGGEQKTAVMPTQADHDRRQLKLSLASLIVSILAIITSITAPFVAYYWLQGALRIYDIKTSSFSAEGEIGTSPSDCAFDAGTPKGASYVLRIENSGSLPIEKVQIVIEKRFHSPNVGIPSRIPKGGVKYVDPDPKIIKTFPPVLINVEKDNRGILITFKDAIPPHSLIFLTLTEFTVLDKDTDVKRAAPLVWVALRSIE